MTTIRITEHTTTDDTYCEVENLNTGETGEWYGDAESFIAEVARPNGMTVEEVVLS
jgi:hypothetical protein